MNVINCKINTLRDWLDYHKKCPLCNYVLNVYFHSLRRQSVKYDKDKVVILFPLNSSKKNVASYKVGYSFNLDDNLFCINFYDKNLFPLEKAVPLFLINRFKELNYNLISYKFLKTCSNCQKYMNNTNNIELDFSTNKINNIKMVREIFGFSQKYNEDMFNIYILDNNYKFNEYSTNKSFIWHWTSWNMNDANIDSQLSRISRPFSINNLHKEFELPLIPFISCQETLSRIKNIILLT